MLKNIIFFSFLQLFLFLGFITFSFMALHIKIYMFFGSIYAFWNKQVFVLKNVYLHEIIFITLYFYIIMTSLYAEDVFLATKLILGEITLILTYLSLRYLVLNIDYKIVENIFLKLGTAFILTSLLLYIAGIIYIYYLHYIPTQDMYLNEHSIRVYGLYMEGSFPRLTGLSESPNSYLYIAFLLMLVYFFKKKFIMFILTLITVILTMSGTGQLLIIIFIGYKLLTNKKTFFYTIGILILITCVLIFLYFNDPFIKYMIDLRMARIESGSGRYDLWYFVLEWLDQSPWIGYGANQSRVILENYSRHYQSAHNSFLDIFLTTGVLGLLIYIFFHISLVMISIKLNKVYKTKIFILAYIEYFIISLSNNTLHVDYVIIYLIFMYIFLHNKGKEMDLDCSLKQCFYTIKKSKFVVVSIAFLPMILMYVYILNKTNIIVKPIYNGKVMLEIGKATSFLEDLVNPLDKTYNLKSILEQKYDVSVVIPPHTTNILVITKKDADIEKIKNSLKESIEYVMQKHRESLKLYDEFIMTKKIGAISISKIAETKPLTNLKLALALLVGILLSFLYSYTKCKLKTDE